MENAESVAPTEKSSAAQWALTAARQPLCGIQLLSMRAMASYPPHQVLDMPALSPTMSQVAFPALLSKFAP